ncbi:hypothetical protein SBRY_20477 [Actinacidiphila bryophytorum]|uniref:Uncharacterized protein n=1 Tax=Actinacidiphila bryophytorum TaxID=1436133 RepID=A0A9W4GZL8_9ACTN|nr:hypothetical protein SBRY_20477 [Actinacidiphila bryophytorum]
MPARVQRTVRLPDRRHPQRGEHPPGPLPARPRCRGAGAYAILWGTRQAPQNPEATRDRPPTALLRLRHAAARRAQPPAARRAHACVDPRGADRRAALPRPRVPLRRGGPGGDRTGARRGRGDMGCAIRRRTRRPRPPGDLYAG